MKQAAGLIGLAFLLSACAGSQIHDRMLETGGDVRIEPTPGPGYDFSVNIRNTVDIGYDPDDLESRQKTALGFARNQCANAQIAGESVVTTGKYLTGRDSKVYSIKIKCPAKS